MSLMRSPGPLTAAVWARKAHMREREKSHMIDHLRVLRPGRRHHGLHMLCGGRGQRAEAVTHLESVVLPLPPSATKCAQ